MVYIKNKKKEKKKMKKKRFIHPPPSGLSMREAGQGYIKNF